jgi:hypothetical protein
MLANLAERLFRSEHSGGLHPGGGLGRLVDEHQARTMDYRHPCRLQLRSLRVMLPFHRSFACWDREKMQTILE